MTTKFTILILGYGEMGHAMEHLLSKRHHIQIWQGRSQQKSLSDVINESDNAIDIVLFCLPVNPHFDIATQLKPLLKPHCLCLSIAKGLDESGKTAAQIFSEVFNNKQPYGLIYGPMISEEIRANRNAFAQVACNDEQFYPLIKNLFTESLLYIEWSPDINGISWSVILKNVYALAFGIADELQLGDNMRGYLAVAALQELNLIVCQMGGNTGSAYHLAGLGDLITTATSKNSHHHELGRKLARGTVAGISGEGIHTLAMIKKYNLINLNKFPLFNLINSVVSTPLHVKNQLSDYLNNIFSH